jgi:hypothetical protein
VKFVDLWAVLRGVLEKVSAFAWCFCGGSWWMMYARWFLEARFWGVENLSLFEDIFLWKFLA